MEKKPEKVECIRFHNGSEIRFLEESDETILLRALARPPKYEYRGCPIHTDDAVPFGEIWSYNQSRQELQKFNCSESTLEELGRGQSRKFFVSASMKMKAFFQCLFNKFSRKLITSDTLTRPTNGESSGE